VSVHGVVTNIHLTIGKPLVKILITGVQNLGEGLRPDQVLGFSRPEILFVGNRFLVFLVVERV
jgi:hypothetical protein